MLSERRLSASSYGTRFGGNGRARVLRCAAVARPPPGSTQPPPPAAGTAAAPPPRRAVAASAAAIRAPSPLDGWALSTGTPSPPGLHSFNSAIDLSSLMTGYASAGEAMTTLAMQRFRATQMPLDRWQFLRDLQVLRPKVFYHALLTRTEEL